MTVRLLALLLAFAMFAFGTTALAQDEDPEAGLGGEADGEDMAGDDMAGDDMAGDDMGGDDLGGDDMGGDDLGGDDLGGGGSSGKPISVALLLGYGLNLDSDATGDLNPFGLGFGVRGGYSLDRIYVGGRIVFFLGESQDVPGGEISFNEFTIGVEGGYDLEMSGLTLRPTLGLGVAISSAEAAITVPFPGVAAMSVDDSSEDLYLAPGASLFYDLKDDIFLGGELQIPVIFANETVLGLTIMVTGGMSF